MNDADRQRVADIRDRCARAAPRALAAKLGSLSGLLPSDINFLLRLVDEQDDRVSHLLAALMRLMDQQNGRVSELIAANNRDVERRRAATEALRLLRRRISGVAWVMDVDGKSVWVTEFIDAAIASAEGDPR